MSTPSVYKLKFIQVPSQGFSDSDKSLQPLQAYLLVLFGDLKHFVTFALYLSLASPHGTTLFTFSLKSPSLTIVALEMETILSSLSMIS